MEPRRPNITDREVINTKGNTSSPFFAPPIDDVEYDDFIGEAPGQEALPIEEESDPEIIKPETPTEYEQPGPPIEVAQPPLDAPSDIQVKTQTMSFARNGQQIVDVVIAFGLVEEAENYEIRVSKA